MKKALYFSAATVLLLALIFAGCDTGAQETLNEEKQTYPTLPAPKNLKARVSPGAIAIAWDVVKDAANYEVWRRDAETQASTKLATVNLSDGTSYLDKVGYSNQLVDKRKYTYTVVAKGKTIGREGVLLDGKASVDATANIPARDSEVVTVENAIKGLAAKAIVSNNQDMLEVTWTGDELVKYSVRYFYGDGTVPLWYENSTDGITGSVEKRQTIPLVGGKTTVKVIAKWDDDEWYANAEKQETFTADATVLPDVYGFSVARAETGIYTLTWNATEGATDYTIWRAALINSIELDTYWQDDDQGYKPNEPASTIGDWQKVEGISLRNGSGYTLVETGVDTSKTWLYGIIATNSGAKSKSWRLSTAKAAAFTQTIATTFDASNIVEISAEKKDASGNTIKDDKGNTEFEPQLLITVDVKNGETITLERAVAEYEYTGNATATLKSVSEYAEVAESGKTTIGARYTWIDKPTVRSSYAYKLTVEKGGYSKEYVAYTSTTRGSYTPLFASGTDNAITISVAKSTEKARGVKITLSNLAYIGDLKADIWQAEAGYYGDMVTVTNSDWIKITGDTPQTYKKLYEDGYIQSGLKPTAYYKYRIELTSTENPDAKLITFAQSARIQPSTANVGAYAPWQRVAGTTNYSIYTTQTPATPTPLDGGTVFVQVWDEDTLEWDLTELTGTFAKAINESTNPPVPTGAYYAFFTLNSLKALNSGDKAKTYHLAVETNTGTYTQFSNDFTVTKGAVTDW